MAGLVLVNPSVMTLRKDAKYLLPVLRFVVPAYPGDRRRHRQTRRDRARLQPVVPVKAMYSLSRAWPVVRRDLAKVTVPVLLLHSRVDHVVEPVNSQIVLDGISSTDVTEIWLENSYHVATMDNDAEEIFTSSVEFIEKVTAGLP